MQGHPNFAVRQTQGQVFSRKAKLSPNFIYTHKTHPDCVVPYFLQDTDIQVHKSMRRIDTMYEMDTEVVVLFLDFNKCQSASNLLVEKLDESVTVRLPEFFHAGTTLETLRYL